ncbi:GIP [Symbiodinium sp. CCMP2592]|nr:GIP [Symbiodinium sp. CCMP2592]
MRVLSPEEPKRIGKGDEKDRIIQPGCLLGDRDPAWLELDRHAPRSTPRRLECYFNVAVSMRYRAAVGDLKHAICQCMLQHRRQGKLHASPPNGSMEGRHVVAGVNGLAEPELEMKIRSIKPNGISRGVVSDAGFANAEAEHSPGAYAILAFDDKLKDGYGVPWSMISWRTGLIQKVMNSTLAAETQSLSG